MRLLIKSINSQLLPVFRQRMTVNRYSNLSIIRRPISTVKKINWLEVSNRTDGNFISSYKRIACSTTLRKFSTKQPDNEDPPL